MEHELIDLLHAGHESSVAAYLLETADGPALFDCGPATTLPALRDGLATAGLEVGDLRHLLLSHIHLDHAGAAGALVAENPSARGARLPDRRTASRRSSPASRRARGGSTASGSTRSGAR